MKLRKGIINEVGNRYGDLTVMSYAGSGKYSGSRWICKCICGKERSVYGGHLRSGNRKSCGCRSQSRIHQTGVNFLWTTYRRKSSLKKREFALTKDQFESFIVGDCFYCGASPSQVLRRQKTQKIQILYNGIDRKDSSVGYVFENCVSACRYCNQAKSILSMEEFKAHIKRIYEWLLKDS